MLSYKEAENLKILLPKIHREMKKLGEEYEVLIIDSEKPLDNTKEVCEQNGAVYINQESPHFGGAFRTGIAYAKMDKFLILDADGSHNPQYIPDIYHKFTNDHCDVVIGSRYVKGGKSNDAITSFLMSRILNTIFRVCLGLKAKDISTDFRMYHTQQLKEVELVCDNFDVVEEVLLKLKINNGNTLNIGEIPIVFDQRIAGESKRRLLAFILSYIKTLFRLTAMRIKGE
jgi:dolichol-phosphate mannosyltransferase